MILAMAATPIAMLHHDHELGARARVRTLARAPVPARAKLVAANGRKSGACEGHTQRRPRAQGDWLRRKGGCPQPA
ncbi:hypothetical protein HMPREF0185_03148 [Brevundimonas diminuta 470-4]|nr:hypothetical protein HMPREF0185_03148 [Brevundimonas diminuta 470-4]